LRSKNKRFALETELPLIFTKDTLRLDSHAIMLSACKKAGTREYVIEIN
jgi:hypothetical protein